MFAACLFANTSHAQETSNAGIELPVLGSVVPAKYPRDSRINREEGRVLVRALISETGWTEKIELKQSSGYPSLDKAAMEAVANWRYTPGKRNGKPITMWLDIPLVFKMQAPAENAVAPLPKDGSPPAEAPAASP